MNPKYKIEDDLDFFSELYKLLDIDEDKDKIDESKICLITQQPLIDKHVELNCGHKFNYLPLYYDLVNFKKKFNLMEGINMRLNNVEIRCPYCRKKQTGLLPYYEELGLEKINGVNFYDGININDPRIQRYRLDEKEKIKKKSKEEKKLKETGEKIIENLVLKTITIQKENLKEINGCIQILKTGPNKGNKCGCKNYLENLCKRHYSII